MIDNGKMWIDDEIGEIVSDIHAELDTRAMAEQYATKALTEVEKELTPRMKRIASIVRERVIDDYKQGKFRLEDLVELSFEPSDDLEHELLSFFLAGTENFFTALWKDDLTRVLNHELDIMIRGGQLLFIIHSIENDGEYGKMMDDYKKWVEHVKVDEYQAVKDRESWWELGYQTYMDETDSDEDVIGWFMQDPRTYALVMHNYEESE